MRYAGGEPSQRGELLRLDNLHLRLFFELLVPLVDRIDHPVEGDA